MNELDSFGNPKFLNDLLSATELAAGQTSPEVSDAAEHSADAKSDAAPDVVLNEVVNEIVEQFRLGQILEDACLATGATGAAIALARGNEMVCRASTGADAPDLGVYLDPHAGLSGSCIQTRQLQQCSDTETDPRVDPEACRHLGVRSIVVLPLVRDNELLGVFEILSSRPNAFGQGDLDRLQVLSSRILQPEGRDSGVADEAPPKGSEPFPRFKEVVSQSKGPASKSDPRILSRQNASKRSNIGTAILGGLVIGVAVLLGAMVGWRLGWQRATVQIRDSSLLHRSNVPPKTERHDEIPLPAVRPQRSSATSEVTGHATGRVDNQRISGATKSGATKSGTTTNPSHSPRGGLTIHQGGKVIFATPPGPDSQRSQPSPGSKADPAH